jgi:hypothetical protein
MKQFYTDVPIAGTISWNSWKRFLEGDLILQDKLTLAGGVEDIS